MEIHAFGEIVEHCSMENTNSLVMKVMLIPLISALILSNNNAIGQILTVARKVIVLDAGHGGIDPGTVSEDGLQEKEVVLDIARNIIFWNEFLLDSKYDIYLTRSKDTLISLDDRAELAKHLKPDIFISLHCNHIDNSKIRGVELYTYNANELSLSYAKTILIELNRHLGFKTGEPRRANFQVLRETQGFCPSILIELGYLSNLSESDYLKDSTNRNVLALAILMSI